MKEFYRLLEKEKIKITKKTSSFLKKKKEISFAFIFGSFLEKREISFRDIDIGIFLEPLIVKKENIFNYETNLAIKISKLISFPTDLIDIKVLNFTSKIFQNNVFSRGLLLFAKNPDLLTSLIEEASRESIINYEVSKQSLLELLA